MNRFSAKTLISKRKDWLSPWRRTRYRHWTFGAPHPVSQRFFARRKIALRYWERDAYWAFRWPPCQVMSVAFSCSGCIRARTILVRSHFGNQVFTCKRVLLP